MTDVNWIECNGKQLPEDKQRVLFYRPQKLTKIGEMIYYEREKNRFLEINSHWAHELKNTKE